MINLSAISTRAPEDLKKDKIKKETKKIVEEIGDLCRMFQASQDKALLIVLQGMDASGKDGTCREVFQHVSPTIVHAHSFKRPTDEEFAHDFLWRAHKLTPGKGKIKVFNRSHYEDILIQRVHKWIDNKKVDNRMAAINAFEQNLIQDNNTIILKFYLHISRDRQKEKLQERIDLPRKNWKHNDNDWKEAELWDEYMKCYEDAINRSEIPWIIAPVDQRWYRNYFIASKVLETLKSLNLSFPTKDFKQT